MPGQGTCQGPPGPDLGVYAIWPGGPFFLGGGSLGFPLFFLRDKKTSLFLKKTCQVEQRTRVRQTPIFVHSSLGRLYKKTILFFLLAYLVRVSENGGLRHPSTVVNLVRFFFFKKVGKKGPKGKTKGNPWKSTKMGPQARSRTPLNLAPQTLVRCST